MIDNKNIKNIFGTALKDLRIKRGLTQEKLAESIGVQPQTIATIETGKRFISSGLLAKLCNFFNVEPYVFFIKQSQSYTPETLDKISNIENKLNEILKIINTK